MSVVLIKNDDDDDNGPRAVWFCSGPSRYLVVSLVCRSCCYLWCFVFVLTRSMVQDINEIEECCWLFKLYFTIVFKFANERETVIC